ncbi:MAG: alpha-L-fucosidase [Planctomycetota bacterium]|nr:MAG: alpha-L-fucosidase [Planctomycetota bacterium]
MGSKRHWRIFINLAVVISLLCPLVLPSCAESTSTSPEIDTKQQHDKRMAWWREARFGMFIHWGLYAVPAGEWKGTTNHAEWILTTAQIPVKEYEKFCPQFNPVKFNANEWVRIAKEAGMKYIVITSKHHDGFCLWDSKLTDYDVIDATPFKRDILRELTGECKKQGIRMCFYHSIMDWHHPDYLPRRDWEKRSSEGADFSRYVAYMKGQVTEIIEQYDPGVLWFDGEWENTWDADLGDDLYAYVRSLKPDIIVNNRVSKGRAGMAGTYDPKKFSGDFGTPEQEIPATGLGYDWETCMTINNHWGYNKHDDNWKPTEDLIHKLVDIASKGGNFLLNVGPTAEGLIPRPSVERLQQMGDWLKVNGESIYGTTASPFRKLQWGRCTQKQLANGDTRLYLHVLDWPTNGKLELSGLDNKLLKAFLLARGEHSSLRTTRKGNDLIIDVPSQAPDPMVSVVALDIKGKPIVIEAPEIVADSDTFVDKVQVAIKSDVSF